MNPIIQEIKQELKKLAEKIILHKNNYKESQRKNKPSWSDLQNHRYTQIEFRHRHIARCLLRGRTYEQIEQKTRNDNKPHKDVIAFYLEEYKKRFEKHLEFSKAVGE